MTGYSFYGGVPNPMLVAWAGRTDAERKRTKPGSGLSFRGRPRGSAPTCVLSGRPAPPFPQACPAGRESSMWWFHDHSRGYFVPSAASRTAPGNHCDRWGQSIRRACVGLCRHSPAPCGCAVGAADTHFHPRQPHQWARLCLGVELAQSHRCRYRPAGQSVNPRGPPWHCGRGLRPMCPMAGSLYRLACHLWICDRYYFRRPCRGAFGRKWRSALRCSK